MREELEELYSSFGEVNFKINVINDSFDFISKNLSLSKLICSKLLSSSFLYIKIVRTFDEVNNTRAN